MGDRVGWIRRLYRRIRHDDRRNRDATILESDPEKQLKYLDFVDLYGGLSEQEIEHYSQTYLSESEEEANMGLKQYLIQKGEARGEIKGEAQTLHKQLRLKFKDLPDWVTQKINQADKAQLDQWVERILFVNSLDELFKPFTPIV